MTDVVVLPGMSDDSRDSPEAKTLYVVVERDSVRPADITSSMGDSPLRSQKPGMAR